MTTDFNLDELKSATAAVMADAGLKWRVEPMWLTTPDSHSPGNRLRVYSGRMTSSTRYEQIDAVSEIIFWFQARRIAQDWNKSDACS
jgi:hypothetical protein